MEGNNRKLNLGKPVPIIILLVLIFIMIYLVSDAGSSGTILSQYGTLTNGSHAGITPQLQFLRIYTMTTGDTRLALKAGLSLDEVEQLVEKGTIEDEFEAVEGGGVIDPPWDTDSLEEAVRQYNESATCSNMKVNNSNGISYPGEIQNSYWTSNGGNGGGCHGLGQGCMWFSSSIAASMVTGRICGVQTLLENRGYSVKIVGGNAYINDPGLIKVGYSGSYEYKDGKPCTPKGLLDGICNVSNDSTTIRYEQSVIDNGGVYLAHVSDDRADKYSRGGQHWFVIAGKNENGYIVLNGAGSIGRDGIFKMEDSELINHWITVTK